MQETVHRVPRPVGAVEDPAKPPSFFSIQRNTFTLVVSIVALVLSLTGAFVNLYTFWSAGQKKALNEADQISIQAEANRVLQQVDKDPASHPLLRVELEKLYKDPLYRPRFDSKLGFFERMAFSEVVEHYAIPFANVQLLHVQARLQASERGTVDLRTESRCFADPYLFGCPVPETDKSSHEKSTDDAK